MASIVWGGTSKTKLGVLCNAALLRGIAAQGKKTKA